MHPLAEERTMFALCICIRSSLSFLWYSSLNPYSIEYTIRYNMATTLSGHTAGDWTWAYLEADGTFDITQGKKSSNTHFVHLIVPCDLESEDYGLNKDLLACDIPPDENSKSIAARFPSLVSLQIQLDFKSQATSSVVDQVKFGDWIGDIAKKMAALCFHNPCDLYLTVTDQSHLFQASAERITALGQDTVDFSDDPGMVAMYNKGCMIQVGQTVGFVILEVIVSSTVLRLTLTYRRIS